MKSDVYSVQVLHPSNQWVTINVTNNSSFDYSKGFADSMRTFGMSSPIRIYDAKENITVLEYFPIPKFINEEK